jgi:hypothetical protein
MRQVPDGRSRSRWAIGSNVGADLRIEWRGQGDCDDANRGNIQVKLIGE